MAEPWPCRFDTLAPCAQIGPVAAWSRAVAADDHLAWIAQHVDDVQPRIAARQKKRKLLILRLLGEHNAPAPHGRAPQPRFPRAAAVDVETGEHEREHQGGAAARRPGDVDAVRIWVPTGAGCVWLLHAFVDPSAGLCF